MDVYTSQACLQVSFGQLDHAVAYYFWAEHMQYCLIWEGSMWFGQIENVQKYNLPNFEYYLNHSSTFDPLVNWSIMARGLRI